MSLRMNAANSSGLCAISFLPALKTIWKDEMVSLAVGLNDANGLSPFAHSAICSKVGREASWTVVSARSRLCVWSLNSGGYGNLPPIFRRSNSASCCLNALSPIQRQRSDIPNE